MRAGAVLAVVGAMLLAAGIGFGLLRFELNAVLSESMTPALQPGDRLLTDTSFADGAGLRRGDVVLLDRRAWPAEPEESELVKRVVAVGGDTVGFAAGKLRVNGEPVDEEYLARGVQPADREFSLRVPPGRLYVLGDNRPASVDSRPSQGKQRGPVRAADVHGKVVAVAWPPAQLGGVPQTGAFGPAGSTGSALPWLTGLLACGVGCLLAAGLVTGFARLRQRQD